MFGYRVHSWGTEPVWEEIDDPVVGDDEVLIEVEACSVGLTVLNCIGGDLDDDPTLLPRVPGHEAVGRVISAGPGADPELIGRRVVAYFYLTCGKCAACREGKDPRCSELGGWVGVHRDGGYAPFMTLPSRNAIPIPDSLDPISATVVPDAVATPVHVAARSQIGPDDRVVVFGAGGGVGIHMVQVARHRGASVAGFDVVDEKLAELDRLGVVPVRSDDLAELDPTAVFKDGAPTVVIDLLGTTASARWAIDGLAMGGRMVALTTFRDRPVPFESRELVFREIMVIGSRYANRAELSEAADLVATGAVEPIIGAVGGPEEVLTMHEQLRAGTLLGRGALDWNVS
ncbi:MAG: D-arabinose 1-dehydrogenase-like Zn-dependent alcohol dehydrogenase [Verrucomicrobiales bacterium]|jgi:D-arabinose 1-dehydrogenase-like Zn-dependent alcohol dehydrogenase